MTCVLGVKIAQSIYVNCNHGPNGLKHFADEREGCVSTITQLIRKRQDLNVLPSDSKTHVLPVYSSALYMEDAQYLFAVYDAAAAIPELMVFLLST